MKKAREKDIQQPKHSSDIPVLHPKLIGGALLTLLITILVVFYYTNALAPITTKQETEPNQKVWVIGPKDFVMAPEEANDFVKNTIQPILQEAIDDPGCPSGIRDRVATFINEVGAGRITYSCAGYYFPPSKKMMARTEPKGLGFTITIFAPAVRDLYREVSDHEQFQWDVALMYAHEQAHVEYLQNHPSTNLFNLQERALDEAYVWGITLTEMVRPLIKSGKKISPSYVHASEQFALVNDNASNTLWVNNFLDYNN